MCKSKRSTTVVEPSPPAAAKPSTSVSTSSSAASPSSASSIDPWQSSHTTSADSTQASLSRLRGSWPETPHVYEFSELRAATNNFLATRFSSSSSAPCWSCTLRGKDAIVFQLKLRRTVATAEALRRILDVIHRSHHVSLIKLLGAAVSGGHVYLAYEFVNGANLEACLRNPGNPNFTVLGSWIYRMQIATDLAHGIDYVHHGTGLKMNLVHNHIKSSSVIVTEPSFNARICYFGTAELCGEFTSTADAPEFSPPSKSGGGEISEIREMERSDSGAMRFEGARGFSAPEFRISGVATQKSDVYAFGVVIPELLSGEEPLKFRFDRARGDFVRTSAIEKAREAIHGGDGGGDGDGGRGRLRRWVDRRLKDSFPVEVAEKATHLALDCVHVDPDGRPTMRRVEGKISKLYLESRIWSDSLGIPNEISVSLAPR